MLLSKGSVTCRPPMMYAVMSGIVIALLLAASYQLHHTDEGILVDAETGAGLVSNWRACAADMPSAMPKPETANVPAGSRDKDFSDMGFATLRVSLHIVVLAMWVAIATAAIALVARMFIDWLFDASEQPDKAVGVDVVSDVPCNRTSAPGGYMMRQTSSNIPRIEVSATACPTRHQLENVAVPAARTQTSDKSLAAKADVVFTAKASTTPDSTPDRSVEKDSRFFCADMHNAARSCAKPAGVDSSLQRFTSAAPNAMDLLTPAEPPSPFPGFPPLTCEPNKPSGGVEHKATPSESSGTRTSASWGSHSGSCGGAGACSSGGASIGNNNGTTVGQDSASNVGATTPMTPIFDLNRFGDDGEELVPSPKTSFSNPAGSSADNDGNDVTPDSRPPFIVTILDGHVAQPDKWSAKGDCGWHALSDDDVPQVSDVRASDLASVAGSIASGRVARARSGGDVLAAGATVATADDATPMWPPAVPRSALFAHDNLDDPLITIEALSVAESLTSSDSKRTPNLQTFRPRDGVLPCVRIDSALDTGLVNHGGGPIGDPWSAVPGRGPLGCYTGLPERPQEPGRAYASVAAAAQLVFNDVKQHSRAVFLAAQAHDASQLQSSQRNLSAAIAQLRDLDLAPHAHTSLTRACKALVFTLATPIATPVSWAAPAAGDSGAGGSWASIGSRVATGDGQGCGTPSSGGNCPSGTPVTGGTHDHSDSSHGDTAGSVSKLSSASADGLVQVPGDLFKGYKDATTPVSTGIAQNLLAGFASMGSSGLASVPGSNNISFSLRRGVWSQSPSTSALTAGGDAYMEAREANATPLEWILNGYLGSLSHMGMLVASMGTTINELQAEVAMLRQRAGQ